MEHGGSRLHPTDMVKWTSREPWLISIVDVHRGRISFSNGASLANIRALSITGHQPAAVWYQQEPRTTSRC